MKLFIADDHGLVREGLRKVLEFEDDLEVVGEAETGQKAVEKVKELRPELVLMDINLPDFDGIEATRRIKAELPETRILMLTVYEDNAYMMKAMQAGASGYILKDIEPDALVKAIRTASSGETLVFGRVFNQFLDEVNRLESGEITFFQGENGRGREEESSTLQPSSKVGGGKNGEQDVAGKPSAYSKLTRREREVLKELTCGLSNREIAERLYISEKTVKNHVSSVLKKLDVGDRTQAVILALKNNLVD